ncbi:hypothetical protein O4H50_21305, partial [Vibrio diazotrophicus]|uniref:hypothetical protein n=1 Tax=Vibrio diazotrophicus TaxID=685 RepID=UPI0022AF8711
QSLISTHCFLGTSHTKTPRGIMGRIRLNKTNVKDVEWFLEQMDKSTTDGSASIPTFIKPFHLACIAIHAKMSDSNISLPSQSEIEKYAVRMGLWEAIGKEPPYQVNRLSCDGRFVEARAVETDDDVHSSSVEVSEMFARTGTCKSTTESLQILAAELLGNCCAHSSDESIFGIVTGQVWHKGNLAQLCIVDCGNGIRRSLENNEGLTERLTQDNACQLATEYGITGKPFGHHSGYGLTLTNDLITQNEGCLIVVSGNECYVNCEGTVEALTLDYSWSGTLIIFEWNTDTTLDVTPIYDSWPTSESLTDETEEDLYGQLFD